MRSLRCRLLDHAAMPGRLREGDSEYAMCMRCGTDLQRAIGGEEWAEVPPSEPVEWRRQDLGCSASAVAARMHLPPAPRRHSPRNTASVEARGQRRSRPRRSALLELTGRFVFESIFERLRRPARPVPASPQLPAPRRARAVSRSRGQSRQG